MIKAIKGIKEILNFIKTLFNILMSIFKTIGMCFRYIYHILNITFTTILTIPSWLRVFCIITIGISVAYFIIGRSAGKSE